MTAFRRAGSSGPSHRWVLWGALLLLPLAVGACAGGPQATVPSPAATLASPRPTLSAAPTPSATPSPTADAQSPYDGIWASKPLTRPDLAAALARHDLSDERLDEWFPDWEGIDYRIFEIEIGDGRWQSGSRILRC